MTCQRWNAVIGAVSEQEDQPSAITRVGVWWTDGAALIRSRRNPFTEAPNPRGLSYLTEARILASLTGWLEDATSVESLPMPVRLLRREGRGDLDNFMVMGNGVFRATTVQWAVSVLKVNSWFLSKVALVIIGKHDGQVVFGLASQRREYYVRPRPEEDHVYPQAAGISA